MADDAANHPDPTALLRRARQGDDSSAEALLPIVYEQLRAMAGAIFRAQRIDHTLQPTALVHEAYMKLVRHDDAAWEGRSHFCAVAAMAMRQILADHARSKLARKRRDPGDRIGLTTIESPSGEPPIDLLALDECLEALATADARGAKVVELRYFGGLSNHDIARVLGVSLPTVERSWRRSRAWLQARLAVGTSAPGGDP